MPQDKKHWMGFNIYAFIKPSTPAEYSALLDEALSELKNLNQTFSRILGIGEGDDAGRLSPPSPPPQDSDKPRMNPGRPFFPGGATT